MPATLPPEVWAARQRAFLDAFPKYGSITKTCAVLDLDRQRVTEWQAENGAFAVAFGHAKEAVADNLESELLRRAMAGEGQMPDTLGIFLLKGYRPMFRESATLNIKQDIRITHSIAELSPDDRIALLKLALSEEAPLLGDGVIDVDAVPQPE